MSASCFLLDSVVEGPRLYAAPLSTAEAIELFPSHTAVVLNELAAERFPGHTWVSREDLPSAATAGELASLFRDEPLSIIDCSVRAGDCQISTHDDGEAEFVCPSEAIALDILSRLAPPHLLSRLVAALQENRGAYVSTETGDVAVYATFDEYLARY